MRNPLINCGNCLAWSPTITREEAEKGLPANNGECRRGQPTCMAIPTQVVVGGPPQMKVVSAFPPRERDSWCMVFMQTNEVMEELAKQELEKMQENSASKIVLNS